MPVTNPGIKPSESQVSAQKPKRARAVARPKPRILLEGEAGLAKVVRQLNKRLEAAGEELAHLELSASDYARLVAVLARIVETALKCEKQRLAEKADPKCADQKELSVFEKQLRLL